MLLMNASLVVGPITLNHKQKESVEWRHPTFAGKKKFKANPSAGNVMPTGFWDAEGVILVALCHMVELLTQICTFKLLKPCRSLSGEYELLKMWLKLPSTRQRTITHKFENTGSNHKTQMDCSLHPPYSPDFAPSDFRLSISIKDAIRGKKV
jgi:hypothetical protein